MIARRTAFQVCEDTGWLTNDDETATAFGNTWVAPVRGDVDIGRLSLKVAEARLVALRRQPLRRCGRGAALSLKSHLIQNTLLMTEARPELGEPSLAKLPPTSGGLKEVWVRSTGLPPDLETVRKKTRREAKDAKHSRGHHPIVSR